MNDMTADQNIGAVKVPNSYFTKEKMSYSYWQQAWFREAIQNALDAGAKNIDFTIGRNPDREDSLRVVCQDNGHGMNEDVLLNTFLSLGGSKKSEGSIGGFGYAKVLLAFAHQRFSIETQNLQVDGISGDYTWRNDASHKQGVRLEVDMTTDDNHVSTMESVLHNLVQHSRLPSDVSITLNGDKLLCGTKDLPYSKPTALGMLSFEDMPDGYSTSTLWVRMKGLAMFPTNVYASSGTAFNGYLELEGNSLDLMTTNRDSLNTDHRSVLSQIMQELSNDREKLKLSGAINLLLNKADIRLDRLDESFMRDFSAVAAKSRLSEDELLAEMNAIANAEETNPDFRNPFRDLALRAMKTKSALDSKTDKIPKHMYPENFMVKYTGTDGQQGNSLAQADEIASSMQLKGTAKLAAGWDRMVKTLLENESYRNELRVTRLGEGVYLHRNEFLIQTGFVYGSPEGLNSTDKDEKHVSIMINPTVVTDQKLSYGDILDLANHELTHLHVDYHNEDFTMKESRLRRICRNEIGEAKIVQCFKDAVADWRAVHSGKNAKVEVKPEVKAEHKSERETEFSM